MKPFSIFLITLIAVPLYAQTQHVRDQIVVTASSVPERLESAPGRLHHAERSNMRKMTSLSIAMLAAVCMPTPPSGPAKVHGSPSCKPLPQNNPARGHAVTRTSVGRSRRPGVNC